MSQLIKASKTAVSAAKNSNTGGGDTHQYLTFTLGGAMALLADVGLSNPERMATP